MFIKIDRSSIKPNPRAGQTATILKGAASASIIVRGEHAFFNTDEFVWVEKGFEPGTQIPVITYLLEKPFELQNILERAKAQGIKAAGEFKQDHETHHHEPIAPYTYRYDFPLISCPECGDSYSLKEVQFDYDDDGNQISYCPSCNNILEMDFTYENINDVIKELKNKK